MALQRLEVETSSFVQERRCGRILDQREVVPGEFLLEEPLAQNHERNDKRDDHQEHDTDAHQLLSPDCSVARPHVRDHNGPRAAALAHEPSRAVAVERSVSVDADAAVLALETAVCAFVYVFLTAAEFEKRTTFELEKIVPSQFSGDVSKTLSDYFGENPTEAYHCHPTKTQGSVSRFHVKLSCYYVILRVHSKTHKKLND